MNTGGGTIDGPTTSGSFAIKAITSNDVSPTFMVKKTLYDNTAGNAKGWNPNGVLTSFQITDDQLNFQDASDVEKTLVSINVVASNSPICQVTDFFSPNQIFQISCNVPPANNGVLGYVIFTLPSHVVTSSLSVSSSESGPSSQSSHSSDSSYPLTSASSQDIGRQNISSHETKSINTLDDIASEFP